MDIDDVFPREGDARFLGACALLAWCMLVLRHGTFGSGVEMHWPGCDRCCPSRASSSACQRTGTQAYFASKVFWGVCGEAVAAAAGAVGLVWTVYEMACFPTLLPSLRWSDSLKACCDLYRISRRCLRFSSSAWGWSRSGISLVYGPDSAENCLEVRGGPEDHRDFTAAVHWQGVAVCRGAEANPHGTETVQKTAKFPQFSALCGSAAVLGQGCLHARCVQTVWGPDVQQTVFRSNNSLRVRAVLGQDCPTTGAWGCSSRTKCTCPLLRRQVQFLNKVAMPVVATTGAFELQSRKLWRFRSCRAWSMFARSSSTVVNVSVLIQRRCLSCSSWTRSLTCSLCPTTGVPQVQFLWLWTSLWSSSDSWGLATMLPYGGFGGDDVMAVFFWGGGAFLAVLTPFFALLRLSRSWVPVFEPSSTHTCECSRTPAN